MAVYTAVSKDELNDFLSLYDLGYLVDYAEIGEGIENSNFFVTLNANNLKPVENKQWVLTLFENLLEQQLPFFLELMSWLEKRGFSVPAPHFLKDKRLYSQLNGKPAILVPRFSGRSLDNPEAIHCKRVGHFVAEMHQALKNCPQARKAPRNLVWMKGIERKLSQVLAPQELNLVTESIDHYQHMLPQLDQCSTGLIHADLFKDNVLYDGDKISGVIDFFHACNDVLLFDLAVIANDWATHDDGSYDELKLTALIEGYQSVRGWEESEVLLWPHFLHLAALRFWLSRLESRYLPGYQQASTQGDQTKSPDELKRIILNLGFVG